MKIIATFIAMLVLSPAYADLYKCKVKGRTTYQAKPCEGPSTEFKLRKDITPEQQQAAQEKLKAELSERAEEQQRLQQETLTQEQMLRSGPAAAPQYQNIPPEAPAPPPAPMTPILRQY